MSRALIFLFMVIFSGLANNFTAHALELKGQAFQIKNSEGWDYLKLELVTGGKALNFKTEGLFELAESMVSTQCEDSSCHLFLHLVIEEIIFLDQAQQSLPSGGEILWSNHDTTQILSGYLNKKEVDRANWYRHRQGRVQEIHLNDYKRSVVGKSTKVRNAQGQLQIYWEIDYPTLYKKLTEFIPVP